MGVCQCIGLEIKSSKKKPSSQTELNSIMIKDFKKQTTPPEISSPLLYDNNQPNKSSKDLTVTDNNNNNNNNDNKDLSKMETLSKSEKREDDMITTVHIVGKEKTGKTSLVIRLCKNKFESFYIPSIDIEISKLKYSSVRTLEKKEMQLITYNYPLFDINKVKNDDFIFVFFDESDIDSIDKAMLFIINNNLCHKFNKERLFLVGNKNDLKTNDFPEYKLKHFCLEKGICFYEISVKTFVGIKQLFQRVSRIATKMTTI